MDIHDSLRQIQQQFQGRFGDLFYRVFLEGDSDVQHYFRDTNLDHQAIILMNALHVIVSHYTQGFPATEAYLKILGNRHFHRQRIPREMYGKFRDALLVALAQFHQADWNPELAGQWREAIDQATQTMLAGYVDGHLVV